MTVGLNALPEPGLDSEPNANASTERPAPSVTSLASFKQALASVSAARQSQRRLDQRTNYMAITSCGAVAE